MRLRDAAGLALSALRGSPVRTLLTILGLAVGVAAVLTVRALGAAGEAQVETEIGRMGVNRVWITPAEGGGVTGEEAALAARASGLPVCAGACTQSLVCLDGKEAAARVAGYDEGMQRVHEIVLTAGRILNGADHREARAVCLIDAEMNERLGGESLGRRIHIGGRRLLIVGVAQTLPLPTMALGGGTLVMPLTTYEDTFASAAQQLTIALLPGQSATAVSQRTLAALGDGFRADTLEKEIGAARQIVHIFVAVLSCVAVVCMLTGGIGVMNVLLVSVRERRREIGLLKALGAGERQVGLIFLLEAAAYAALGGLLGLVLGAGMIRLCGGIAHLSAEMKPGECVIVLMAASVLGAVFGAAPAVRAARLPVVQALRSE